MAGSPTSFRVEVLTEDQWRKLRRVRLTALRDSPAEFLASHEREKAYGKRRWRQEFSRGEWNVVIANRKMVGLLGVTREPKMSAQECYLEYLWIAPGFRRSGVGSMLMRTVLGRLRKSGVHTVRLYILDGNQAALGLYQGFGFQSTNERQPLPDHPAGNEELWELSLDGLDYL